MAFRLIRELIPLPHQSEGRRALIYGAGDGGEMVLRELRKNGDWNLRPVGFIDDDPLKQGKLINGLRVFDSNGSFEGICREENVKAVLISTPKIDRESLRRLRDFCTRLEIEVLRAQMKIEPIDFE